MVVGSGASFSHSSTEANSSLAGSTLAIGAVDHAEVVGQRRVLPQRFGRHVLEQRPRLVPAALDELEEVVAELLTGEREVAAGDRQAKGRLGTAVLTCPAGCMVAEPADPRRVASLGALTQHQAGRPRVGEGPVVEPGSESQPDGAIEQPLRPHHAAQLGGEEAVHRLGHSGVEEELLELVVVDRGVAGDDRRCDEIDDPVERFARAELGTVSAEGDHRSPEHGGVAARGVCSNRMVSSWLVTPARRATHGLLEGEVEILRADQHVCVPHLRRRVPKRRRCGR